MEKLKELWSRFKVQISFVAGCLVVATSLGTCTFDPTQTSSDVEAEEVEAPAEPAVEVAPQTESTSTTTSTTETTTLEETNSVESDEAESE